MILFGVHFLIRVLTSWCVLMNCSRSETLMCVDELFAEVACRVHAGLLTIDKKLSSASKAFTSATNNGSIGQVWTHVHTFCKGHVLLHAHLEHGVGILISGHGLIFSQTGCNEIWYDKFVVIVIIIKKGPQCKDGRDRCTLYQSEDPSLTIQTNRKNRKGKQ